MPRDPEKQRAAKRRWYEKNKHVYLARNVVRRQERLAYLKAVKQRPCADCEIAYPPFVMDFDHREGEEKLALVSRLANQGSMTALKVEIAKCDIVCANCHRFRTFARSHSEMV